MKKQSYKIHRNTMTLSETKLDTESLFKQKKFPSPVKLPNTQGHSFILQSLTTFDLVYS